MNRLFFILSIIFLGWSVTISSCQNMEHGQKEQTSSTYANYYLADLDETTDTPDSTLSIVKELLTDSMRWWGMDIVYTKNYNIHQEEIHKKHLKKISIAEQWSKRHHPNEFILGKIWNQKGLYYINMNNTDSAIYCFTHAYDLLSATKAYNQLSTATINLASAYYRLGAIPTAARYYKRAALLADSLHSKTNFVSIRIGLAQVYADLHNLKLAQENLDEAKKYLSAANFYEKYFYYIARGVCFYYQKEYSMSYASFNIASKYAKEISPFQQVICQASLSEAARAGGNLQLALPHVDYCLEFQKNNPDMRYQTVKFYILSISANVLLANGQIAEAQKILKDLPLDKDVKMLRYLSLHYTLMSEYAESQKDYTNAYKYLKIAHTYKDSINNDNAINKIIEIAQRYQRDTTLLKQNVTIANIEANSSHYRLRLFLVIGGLCLMITCCILTIIIIKRRNDKRFIAQIGQISKLRMDVVRNRISPHYVFNVLGMMLPKFKSNPELHQLSELFIDIIRGNLIASSQLSIQFSEETRMVKQYIDLYHKTTSPYPIVKWHDATNGECNNIIVPTMCVQIPVENALKHAFKERNENCAINIFIMTEDRRLILNIIDNGQGYDPGKVTPTGRDTGTGLRVLSRTIALLNQQNSQSIEFHINNIKSDKDKGTKVQISIPFEYQYTKIEKRKETVHS